MNNVYNMKYRLAIPEIITISAAVEIMTPVPERREDGGGCGNGDFREDFVT